GSSVVSARGGPPAGQQIPAAPPEMNDYFLHVPKHAASILPYPSRHFTIAEDAFVNRKRRALDGLQILSELPAMRKYDLSRFFGDQNRCPLKTRRRINIGGRLRVLAVEKQELRDLGVAAMQRK